MVYPQAFLSLYTIIYTRDRITINFAYKFSEHRLYRNTMFLRPLGIAILRGIFSFVKERSFYSAV